MSLLTSLQKVATARATALLPELLKKGKTEQQCACIDFLFEKAVGNAGCLGKKKKGGCFGKASMTMDEYCQHVQNTVDNLFLKKRALAKIGLEEALISAIPPIALHTFLYTGSDVYCRSDATEIGGIYRNVSNKYSVTWIFFSSTQIYTYTYIFDTISDNVLEYTKEFFYSDITCIKIEHQVEELIIEKTKGCGCLSKKKQDYEHHNKHWDTFQITVPGESYSFTCRSNEAIENSIRAANAIIRANKRS